MVPCTDSEWWEELLSLPETMDNQLDYSDYLAAPFPDSSSSSTSLPVLNANNIHNLSNPGTIQAPTLKKTRKIEMKKNEKKTSLHVTFTKRRQGLFKKAGDLSVLTGAEIAVLAMSPAGKIFSFGSPSPDHLIKRFLSQIPDDHETVFNDVIQQNIKLEAEKHTLERCDNQETYWWKKDTSKMELCQLENFASSMEVLHRNIVERTSVIEDAGLLLRDAFSRNF